MKIGQEVLFNHGFDCIIGKISKILEKNGKIVLVEIKTANGYTEVYGDEIQYII